MINLFGPCKTTVLLSDPSALTVTTVLELHVVTSSWHAFGNPNSFFSLQGPKALGPCTRAKGVSNYLLQYPLSSSLIPSIPTPGMSSSYFCPSSPQISQTLPLTCPVSELHGIQTQSETIAIKSRFSLAFSLGTNINNFIYMVFF